MRWWHGRFRLPAHFIPEKNRRFPHCHSGMETASILIVEDEGLIALDLRKKLEQAGYRVAAIADNATDALAAVERFNPSLVLMDIRIRGPQDGIETAGLI